MKQTFLLERLAQNGHTTKGLTDLVFCFPSIEINFFSFFKQCQKLHLHSRKLLGL